MIINRINLKIIFKLINLNKFRIKLNRIKLNRIKLNKIFKLIFNQNKMILNKISKIIILNRILIKYMI